MPQGIHMTIVVSNRSIRVKERRGAATGVQLGRQGSCGEGAASSSSSIEVLPAARHVPTRSRPPTPALTICC